MGGNRQDMDKPKNYKIVLSKDALQDIKNTKAYILQTFMYREYAENFSKKIKAVIKALDPFAEGYEKTGYNIEGLEIYYKPYSTYLIFFVVEDATVTVIRVLKDRMYWQAIINRMKRIVWLFLIKINSHKRKKIYTKNMMSQVASIMKLYVL